MSAKREKLDGCAIGVTSTKGGQQEPNAPVMVYFYHFGTCQRCLAETPAVAAFLIVCISGSTDPKALFTKPLCHLAVRHLSKPYWLIWHRILVYLNGQE